MIWIMGNPHSRPEDRLRYISREVNSLRSSLRTSRQNISKDKKEYIVSSLAHHSGEVSSMHGKAKKKNIEDTLKNISEVMEEVLKIEPSELDGGAIESNSFVHVPIHQRSNSLGSLGSSKRTRQPTPSSLVNRSSLPNLRHIEDKLSELKNQINTAIENKDSNQLRVHQQTIKILATDLELIYTEKDTPSEKRKAEVDKKIVSLYQRVSKALAELKKSDNLRNKSKQYKKDKAMNDLADIEIHLAENESLLDKLIKEKNSSEFAKIRNNIVENNQRLARVEVVDNDVKEKIVILSQKLTETVKTLDRIMAKREFDSKFSKSLESYERIVRNFNPNTNSEDTLNNLQSLRNSIQNLEEINDTTKNRKRELLNNINYQLTHVSEAVQKESDKKIIEEIVEDTVVLRKKVKSTDKEHTLIDQFINYWNNVKSNFDVDSYSKLSLLRIDSILAEMQHSINDIRVEISSKCDTNPPSDFNRKHSQSVPKLNARKSYGSNKSLDVTDNKIIKTKAKMYNISTPELQSVEKQSNPYINSRFSKIEEIKLQVHYIKEKIDEAHNKNIIREKLETYHQKLGEFVKDSNKTVSSNAILVSNEIVELLHLIVLAEFKEKTDILSKKVHKFNGTRYDKEFDEMKEELIKLQIGLETFNIPKQYKTLVEQKGELLDEVVNSIESLQEKGSYFRKQEDDNVRQIKNKLQVLGDKVKRFSGTFKSVLYNNIERDLNKLLLDVGEQVDDKVWSNEITRETERLLKILEQRSSLAQSFRGAKPEETKTEDQIGMTKIKHDLYNIKREIDRTPESNVDAFIGLQSRLDLVNFELSQIAARSNENLAKEKEIFSNEAQTLKNVVDAKVALGQQPMVQWPERELHQQSENRHNNLYNKIEQFENAFTAIKNDISAPNSEQDVYKFYKLSQDIKNLMENLNRYKFMRGSDLYIKQTHLLNEMQYYVEALDKGAIDVDYVISLEKNLDKLEQLFGGTNQQQDLKSMAIELQTIQKKLQEHKFNTSNETLRCRKNSVQQKTEDLAQKLKNMEGENKQLQQNMKKVADIEEKTKIIEPQVTSFIGLKEDNKYYELNETIIRHILILDEIDCENEELQKRKIKLLKEFDVLGQILDERAQQTKEIVNLELSLDEVSSKLHIVTSNDDLNKLKNQMDNIKHHLQKIKVSHDMVSRKNACIEKFSSLFNKCMTLSSAPKVQSQLEHFQTEHSSGYSSRVSSSYHIVTEHSASNTSNTNILSSQASNEINVSKTVQIDNILAKIAEEIKQIEVLVKSTTDFKQLQMFDEAITQYTQQIENLKVMKKSVHYKTVLELYEKMNNVTDVIEEKIQEHDWLNSVTSEIDEISNKMDTALTYAEINKIDERLIQLQVTLGKSNNSNLRTQIDGCMLRIILCLQKISEFRASVQSTQV